jgi:ribA/ribD-fused uncharacterized protein
MTDQLIVQQEFIGRWDDLSAHDDPQRALTSLADAKGSTRRNHRIIRRIEQVVEPSTAEDVIDSFSGQYRFLSNFWPARVFLGEPFAGQSFWYDSVETAYQAAKTNDMGVRKQLTAASARDAKALGKKLVLRPDWNEVKVPIMAGLLMQKFADPERQRMLLDTGSKRLVEGNTWNDTFWGVCDGRGANRLGRLLEMVRLHYSALSKI